MPTVLTTNKTTNQTLVPFLAAFHNASPFQISDQIKTGARNAHPQSDINGQDCPPHPPIMFPHPPIMLYITPLAISRPEVSSMMTIGWLTADLLTY